MPMRKVCYIPTCSNTSENSNKLFLRVPNDLKIRKIWWQLAKIQTALLHGHEVYCCEDHFNVEEDTQNWMYFKTIGSVLKLKPGIFPHKFIDNPPSIPLCSSLSGSAEKRKLNVLQNLVQDCDTEKKIRRLYQASTSRSHVVRNIFAEEPDTELVNTQQTVSSPSGKFEVNRCSIKLDVPLLTRNVAVQVALKCKKMRSVQTNTNKVFIYDSVAVPSNVPSATKETLAITSSESMPSSDSEYLPSSSSEEVKMEVFKEDRQKSTILVIEKNSRFYLGIPNDVFKIVTMICTRQNLIYMNVLLALKKIRLDDTYFRLSKDFGISISEIHRIFVDTIPKIANATQNLIFWPEADIIKKLLPIPFRARYSNVQSIIDCFEIEIEKPSNPVFQASTWSEYKHCNTVKFLISSTPNGLINFISEAYAGRTSDKDMVVQSKYLEKLPRGAHILADRGFKHVNNLITEKECVLVRPPSVSTSEKSSPQEVKQSKRIASLRIHIERVIRRIREFAILRPHSCINHNLLYLLNSILIIVCGLVNLQKSIIK